jgi:hypothetical protein
MDIVTREFLKELKNRKGHNPMGMTVGAKQQFKLHIRRGKEVKHITMRKYLRQAGYRINDEGFSENDMLEAIKFTLSSSEFTRQLGAEYILEKFIGKQQQQLSF